MSQLKRNSNDKHLFFWDTDIPSRIHSSTGPGIDITTKVWIDGRNWSSTKQYITQKLVFGEACATVKSKDEIAKKKRRRILHKNTNPNYYVQIYRIWKSGKFGNMSI